MRDAFTTFKDLFAHNAPRPANAAQEKSKPQIGVAVIVLNEGKVLLGQRKGAHCKGTWASPGGHLEFGETVEACAKRELAEETGLQALSWQLGPWAQNFMQEEKKHYITLFVFVDQFAGELQLLEPAKCEQWCWFEWDQLPTPLFSTVSSLIRQISIEQLKQPLKQRVNK